MYKFDLTLLITVTLLIIFKLESIEGKQCIKTKVGRSCKEDTDCYEQNETHLFCNKTLGVNICAFHYETYIGHVTQDVDCPGQEFSAEPWTNPIRDGLMDQGIDCMRMCLHIHSCFGVTILHERCYLKNEKCFGNLSPQPGAIVGVLNVVREDYRCGCHYPFTRKKSDGETLTWNPQCPESQLTRNPFRCCSDHGLCVQCGNNNNNNNNGNSGQGSNPSMRAGNNNRDYYYHNNYQRSDRALLNFAKLR